MSGDLLTNLMSFSYDPKVLMVRTKFGRTSNGYLEYIFRRAASEINGVFIDNDVPLVYKQGKNRHYQEVTYPGTDLRFVSAYGFQHIQNIIRKLKTHKCDFDYVELMACPSGCLNGGGQIKFEVDVLEQLRVNCDDMKVRELHFDELDSLIEDISKRIQSEKWFECDFHPIDQNDPMVQAAQSIKW